MVVAVPHGDMECYAQRRFRSGLGQWDPHPAPIAAAMIEAVTARA